MPASRRVVYKRTGRSAPTLRPALNTQALELLNMSSRDLPAIQYLRQRLRYEAATGKLYWREHPAMPPKWNGKWAGRQAGSTSVGKYSKLCLDGKMLKAHRVAWALHHGVWPEDDIDHINHDRTDNRASNLRVVSRQENCRNSSLSRRNTSGHAGITWCKRTHKWMAQIHPDGRGVYLGRYAKFDEAVAARKAAEVRYGFHDNHGAA